MSVREMVHNAFKAYIRGFPIAAGKYRLVSAFWKPLSFSTYKRETTLKHDKIHVSCDLTKYLQRQLYFFGDYEEECTKFWTKLASDATIIFDVGANIGLYALIAATVHPDATIHAFEPTPEVLEVFRRNIELNHLNNIRLREVAIGTNSSIGYLQYCTGNSGHNEGMNFVTPDPRNQNDLQVQTVSIDDYCHQHGIDYIDLMKMDIEGGEYNALMGASRYLEDQAIGCIFMELTEWAAQRYGHTTAELLQILADAHYKICYLDKGILTELPFEHKHVDNIVAFAQKHKFSAKIGERILS